MQVAGRDKVALALQTVAVFLHAVTGVKTAGETDGTRCPRLAKTYSIVVEKPLAASTFRRGKFVHKWQFVLFQRTYSIRGTFICTKAASTSQWTETICLYIFPICFENGQLPSPSQSPDRWYVQKEVQATNLGHGQRNHSCTSMATNRFRYSSHQITRVDMSLYIIQISVTRHALINLL